MRLLVLAAVALSAAALSGSTASTTPRALLTYSISYRSLGGSGPPSGRVCLANSDGSHAVRLLSKGDYREVAWSPGGRYFVFSKQTTARERRRGAEIFELYLANAKGRILRNLSRGWAAFNGSPAWSPDGRWIAFTGAWRGSAIALVARKGGKPRLLVEGGGSPSWAPDGSRIAFSRADGIAWSRPNGTDEQLLIRGATEPRFSYDGTKLAYVRQTGAAADVYVANVDGSDERRLTTSAEAEWAPAWSPDGSLIAFNRSAMSPADDRFAVVVVDAASGEEHAVITGPHSAFDPSWRRPLNLPRAKRPRCR